MEPETSRKLQHRRPGTGGAIRLILCLDEPIAIAGLRAELRPEEGFEITGVTGTLEGLHGILADLAGQVSSPDVVLVSYALDPTLQFLRPLREAHPNLQIVLWGRDYSPEAANTGLRFGAVGFLSSTASAGSIQECLRLSVAGKVWMEHSLSNLVLNNRPVTLSKRQTELLSLLTQGLKNREIAEAMGLSEGTVKSYLTTLFEKVGARDRFELALYGLKTLGGGQSPKQPAKRAGRQRGLATGLTEPNPPGIRKIPEHSRAKARPVSRNRRP